MAPGGLKADWLNPLLKRHYRSLLLSLSFFLTQHSNSYTNFYILHYITLHFSYYLFYYHRLEGIAILAIISIS